MKRFKIKTQTAILRTLIEIQLKHARTFSQVKLKTIRKLLIKIYKIKVSLSDISYHLTVLRKNHLINTWERYGTNPDGTHFNLPSNRSVTPKGMIYLIQCGMKIAKYLYDWAFLGIKPKRYKDITDLPKQSHVHTRPLRQSTGTFQSIGETLKLSRQT